MQGSITLRAHSADEERMIARNTRALLQSA